MPIVLLTPTLKRTHMNDCVNRDPRALAARAKAKADETAWRGKGLVRAGERRSGELRGFVIGSEIGFDLGIGSGLVYWG